MTRTLNRPCCTLVLVALLSQGLAADDTEVAQPGATAPSAAPTSSDAEKTDGESAAAPATEDAVTTDKPAVTEEAAAAAEGNTDDAPPVEATESESTSPGTPPAANDELARWQELHQQWLALDQRLRDAEFEFYGLMTQQDLATKERRNQLRFEFEDLIKNEANPLLKKLRAEVIKAYRAAPNDDIQLVRLLVGYMVNHARMQEKADAEEIVELLIENKADPRYVLVDARASRLRPTSAELLEQLQNRYKQAMAPEKPNGEQASSASGGGLQPDDGGVEGASDASDTADSANTDD